MSDKQPRLGVAVVIRDRTNRIVLGKRAQGPNAGKWVLPGGGVEVGEKIDATAYREVLEETGLMIYNVSAPIYTMQIIGPDSHRVCLVVTASTCSTSFDGALKTSDELTNLAFFDRQALMTTARIVGEPGYISAPVRECLVALGAICEHEGRMVVLDTAPKVLRNRFWGHSSVKHCANCGYLEVTQP